MTNAISKLHINADMIRSLCMALCFVMVLSLVMVSNTQVAFCNDAVEGIEQIGEIGNTVATAIYKLIRSIVTPIVIIAFAAAGLQFLIGGNQGTEKAKKIIIGACAGLILVVFAPLFGQYLAKQFSSFGGDDLSQFNPFLETKPTTPNT